MDIVNTVLDLSCLFSERSSAPSPKPFHRPPLNSPERRSPNPSPPGTTYTGKRFHALLTPLRHQFPLGLSARKARLSAPRDPTWQQSFQSAPSVCSSSPVKLQRRADKQETFSFEQPFTPGCHSIRICFLIDQPDFEFGERNTNSFPCLPVLTSARRKAAFCLAV
jgi:hypothetical protein